MRWVMKGSTYRAERNGKLIGYIQQDRISKFYKWTCGAFSSRAESKNCGMHPNLDGAKQALEDFWNLSLTCYGLIEDPSIKDNRDPSLTEFSDGDVKDLNELF